MNAATLTIKGPIVIATGGTGGHLFPGQALAEELKRREHAVVLITDDRVRKFDTLFPGVDVYAVPAATFADRVGFGKVEALVSIVSGVMRSYRLLGQIKPSVVIGFGGYPSLPPVLAALLRGVPVCVHEQNAVLGRVNRLVAPYVRAIASTFPKPAYLKPKYASKLAVTGNPVRDAVIEQVGLAYNAPEHAGNIRLLVFGGSQGARIMSDVVPDALARLPAALRARLRVTQQCRAEDLERVRARYVAAGVETELASFFDTMPARIAQAHLIIGRSGASTVSELAVIGRPSILVPLPHSLDNDQKANASVLADAGAAWMIEQKDFTGESLARRLQELLAAPEKLVAAAAAARGRGEPRAVQLLADLVVAVGERRNLPAGKDRRGSSGPGRVTGIFLMAGDAL